MHSQNFGEWLRDTVARHRRAGRRSIRAFGVYHTRIRGVTDWQEHKNLLPTEGINYLLDQVLGGGSSAPLYIALYAGAVSPASGWTAASFPATASEITSGTEGYTESTRQQWVSAAAASGTKDNYANVAAFTIATASTLVVNGVAMLTQSAKGSTGGKLLSASRFGSTQNLSNTNIFDVKYRLGITSS